MKTYRLAVAVAPTTVDYLAAQFGVAGFDVTCVGTQHIHLTARFHNTMESWVVRFTFCAELKAKLGTTFGVTPSDVMVLGSEGSN